MKVIEFFAEPAWQRVGMTLVHFLWQGLAAAVLAGMVVRLLGVRRGNGRYGVYLAAFAVMAACPVVTFFVVEGGADVAAVPVVSEAEAVEAISFEAAPIADERAREVERQREVEVETVEAASSASLRERITAWYEVLRPWMLLCWVAGVVMLSGRLLLGMVGLRRWRRHVEPLEEGLRERVSRIAERLGIGDFAGVFFSARAVQAMAVGCFRPMVLLPAAMVMRMDVEMLEAVIAHELAHIRRLDLWVNLGQRVVEAFLFYHPAVWWLSNRLRDEREYCCDELAVEATGERLKYAATLENASRGVFSAREAQLAAGFGKEEMPILGRVRHILGIAPSEHKGSFWMACIVGVLMLGVVCAGMALVFRQEAKGASPEEIRQMVLKNEELMRVIKMDYRCDHIGDVELQEPSSGRRRAPVRAGGRKFSYRTGVWAQKDDKLYSMVDFFYGPNERAAGSVCVFDGEVVKKGRTPDLMQGSVDELSEFDWFSAGPMFLGLRLRDNRCRLSDMLVAEHATLKDETETVEGRETYVVDLEWAERLEVIINREREIRTPMLKARVWIDCERGLPLLIENYEESPDSGEVRVTSRIESIELHQLPNGGWIPVKGSRSFPGSGTSRRFTVDVSSITIDEEDIPDSLFTLTFAEGASVYDGFLAKKLETLGKVLSRYAEEHEGRFPDELKELETYDSNDILGWATHDVGYIGQGKMATQRLGAPAIAYDKTLLGKGGGTNVLSADGRVGFARGQILEMYGIAAGSEEGGEETKVPENDEEAEGAGVEAESSEELLEYLISKNSEARQKISSAAYKVRFHSETDVSGGKRTNDGEGEVKLKGRWRWSTYSNHARVAETGWKQDWSGVFVLNDKYIGHWPTIGNPLAYRDDHSSIETMSDRSREFTAIMNWWESDILNICFKGWKDAENALTGEGSFDKEMQRGASETRWEAREKKGEENVYEIRRFRPSSSEVAVVWTIDGNKGFCVTEVAAFYMNNEGVWEERTITPEEVAPGIWFPTGMQEKRFDNKSGKETGSTDVRLEDIRLNISIPDEQFGMDALGCPDDIEILWKTVDGETIEVRGGAGLVERMEAIEKRRADESRTEAEVGGYRVVGAEAAGEEGKSVVRGYVYGADGEGLENVTVRIREEWKAGGSSIATDVVTDANGHYEYDQIEGRYHVGVIWYEDLADGSGRRHQSKQLNKVLEKDQTIDFHLGEFPQGNSNIGGQVRDQNGDAVKDFTVDMRLKAEDRPGEYSYEFGFRRDFSYDDGGFTFLNLPEGTYRLGVIPAERAYTVSKPHEIELGEEMSTIVDVQVEKDKAFYGRLLFEDGAAAKFGPDLKTNVSVVPPLGGPRPPFFTPRLRAEVDDEGYFTVYLWEAAIESARSGDMKLPIEIQLPDRGVYMNAGEFPGELLAPERVNAGVFKIKRPPMGHGRQAEGDVVFDEDIPVTLSIGSPDNPLLVRAKTIRFEEADKGIRSQLTTEEYLDPIFQWYMKIEVLDSEGNLLDDGESYVTNRGERERGGAWVQRAFGRSYSRVEPGEAKKFRVTLEYAGERDTDITSDENKAAEAEVGGYNTEVAAESDIGGYVDELPEGWSLEYDSGEREEGFVWWPGVGKGLAELRVIPVPLDEYDESWKQERLSFEVSCGGEYAGSIFIRNEIGNKSVVVSPGVYKLSYSRWVERLSGGGDAMAEHGSWRIDMSKSGRYELKFTPKLAEGGKPEEDGYAVTKCVGKVVDAGENPVVGADVEAYEVFFSTAGGLDMRLIGKTVADESGLFTFETKPTVRKNRSLGGWVTACAERMALGWEEWPLYGEQRVTIKLGEKAGLSGRVVDENGKGVRGAEVRACLHEGKRWLPNGVMERLTVMTDRQGRFEFKDIPAYLDVDLYVSAEGKATIYTSDFDPASKSKGHVGHKYKGGQTDIRVVLPDEGRVEGRFVDEESGEGVGGVKLAIVPKHSGSMAYRRVLEADESGEFEIGGLTEGRYLIRGDFPHTYVEVKRGQSTEVEIKVKGSEAES